MLVVDKIADCKFGPWPASASRSPDVCEFIVLHRCDIGDGKTGNTPEQVAQFFTDPQLKTGKRMPYHFFIDQSGTVFQCVPISIVAPGAVNLNPAGIQVATDGDFRKKPPTEAQTASIKALVTELLRWKPTLKVVGHTENTGATLTPGKICPGKYLVPATVRLAALDVIAQERKLSLKSQGFTL